MAPEIPALKKLTEPHARQDRVRLTLCIHRKPGTSVEEFQRYWREEHSQLFAGIAVVKSNLLTYEQVHVDEGVSTKLKEMGLGLLEADGMAIFEAISWDKLLEVFQDQEYQNVVVPDEEKFIDRKKALAFPSSVVPVFDDPT